MTFSLSIHRRDPTRASLPRVSLRKANPRVVAARGPGGGGPGARGVRGGGAGQRDAAASGSRPRSASASPSRPTTSPPRASQLRVLEADAGLEPLTDRLVAPWVDRTPEGFVVDVRGAPAPHASCGAGRLASWAEVRDALRRRCESAARCMPTTSPRVRSTLALDASSRRCSRCTSSASSARSCSRSRRTSCRVDRSLDYLAWMRGARR